jgi:hypothetical protein
MGLVVVFISLRSGVRLILDWRMKEKARRTEAAEPPPGGISAGTDTGGPAQGGGS